MPHSCVRKEFLLKWGKFESFKFLDNFYDVLVVFLKRNIIYEPLYEGMATKVPDMLERLDRSKFQKILLVDRLIDWLIDWLNEWLRVS